MRRREKQLRVLEAAGMQMEVEAGPLTSSEEASHIRSTVGGKAPTRILQWGA